MPPARATLPPTPGLCKSSRPPAPSVLLPWRAVLLSAPSKHCARRRLLAHTPKAAGQRAGSPLPALSPPPSPLPGGRCSSAKGRPAALAGNRTRVNCLEGSYAHLYTIAKSPNSPVIGSISSLSKRRTNASIYGSKLFRWKKISELYFPLLFTLGRHLRVILSPPYLSSTLISIQSLKPYLIYL